MEQYVPPRRLHISNEMYYVCHIPTDSNFHSPCSENLKPRLTGIFLVRELSIPGLVYGPAAHTCRQHWLFIPCIVSGVRKQKAVLVVPDPLWSLAKMYFMLKN